MNKKVLKNQEQKKVSPIPKDQHSKKQNRKAENPVRVPPPTEPHSDFRCANSWICKNSACRSTRSIEDTFCKRCSCCICHLYDDNKDPSIWLECISESGQGDSCGLSCHIECALQHKKVGVVDLGQLMQLDGSYCCFSCGKVSGILGYWKKQLSIAKDARRVDMLCYRILLSYRLLEGTSKFRELHKVVEEAKAKLETEVGPVSGVSAKMARGIVSRLSVAGDVQSLCSLAIEKADEWLASKSSYSSSTSRTSEEGSLPAACKFLFEEVTSSSIVIVLIELSSISSDDIKGYKLWYCKTRDDAYTEDPVSVFPRTQRRILISSLQPSTEYSFRIMSYTEAGDFGHSEAKCFTKSVEIFHKNSTSVLSCRKDNPVTGGSSTGAIESDSGFKVRDLGKILKLAWAREQGCPVGLCGVEAEKCCEVSDIVKHETKEDPQTTVSRQLDLNVASVPDLNEDITPSIDFSLNEENVCTVGATIEADDDAVSHEIVKNGAMGSNGSGDSHNWNNTHNASGPPVDSNIQVCRKRGAASRNAETHDSDSTLINGSPLKFRNGSGSLDENFEYCVKIIRWLECEGHITMEFRLKLLTWFSLRSTEQERRIVNTFIQTLIDDPNSLGGQLVDSFSDIISMKKPRNGFCSKLWH